MIKRMMQRWLGLPVPDTATEVIDPNPGFGDLRRNGYMMSSEGKYFMLRKAENGYVLTVRVYPDKPSTSSGNPYGTGPTFQDRAYIIKGGMELAETINRIIVKDVMGI